VTLNKKIVYDSHNLKPCLPTKMLIQYVPTSYVMVIGST
jgi:hypothetical protein